MYCLGYDNGGPGLIEVNISLGLHADTDAEPPSRVTNAGRVENTAAYTFLRSYDGNPAPSQTPGLWPRSLNGGDGH
jgi:hypothetical protein